MKTQSAKQRNTGLAEAFFTQAATSVVQVGDDVVIRGRQPISFNDGVAAVSLNPTHFPGRLAQEARLYSRWKCLRLDVHYIPNIAATVAGSCTIGTIDYGVTTSDLENHLVNSNGGCQTSVWQAAKTRVNVAAYCDRYRNCFGSIDEETTPTVIIANASDGDSAHRLVVSYEFRMRNRASPEASYRNYEVWAQSALFIAQAYPSVDEAATRYGLRCSSVGRNDHCMLLAPLELGGVSCYKPGSDTTTEEPVAAGEYGKVGTILDAINTSSTAARLIDRWTNLSIRDVSNFLTSYAPIISVIFKDRFSK